MKSIMKQYPLGSFFVLAYACFVSLVIRHVKG